MTSIPPYDLALDEMSVALSYILLSSGVSIPAPAAAAPAPVAAPVKKEAPKKVCSVMCLTRWSVCTPFFLCVSVPSLCVPCSFVSLLFQ